MGHKVLQVGDSPDQEELVVAVDSPVRGVFGLLGDSSMEDWIGSSGSVGQSFSEVDLPLHGPSERE